MRRDHEELPSLAVRKMRRRVSLELFTFELSLIYKLQIAHADVLEKTYQPPLSSKP
jgi:hypothetical protein